MFTNAGMNQFVPVLPRRGTRRPGRRATLGAEVRPPARQAQRHRRAGQDPPPPHVLRDARQLELRRLLQGATPSSWPGSCSPRSSASTATGSGSPSTPPTTRPRRSGTSRSASRSIASSGSTRTTSGRWARRVRAGPCSEIHYDCGPEWGDAGGPAHGGGDRYVEFWNLVFMQIVPQRRRQPQLTCPRRTSTPAAASSAG